MSDVRSRDIARFDCWWNLMPGHMQTLNLALLDQLTKSLCYKSKKLNLSDEWLPALQSSYHRRRHRQLPEDSQQLYIEQQRLINHALIAQHKIKRSAPTKRRWRRSSLV
jgi:hypothetical protein